MHCGDQRHLGLCLGDVPALAYGSCRVSDQGTTLRASDLHNARATILNPFNKVWGEIIYPFPNFNSATVDVWEWISNFLPPFFSLTCNYLFMSSYPHAGISQTDVLSATNHADLGDTPGYQMEIDFNSLLPDWWCNRKCQSLHWRHNGRDSVSNHQPHECLLNRSFRRRSKDTSKLRVTGLCVGNSPETGEFAAQMASYAENVSIWWRHHVILKHSSPTHHGR